MVEVALDIVEQQKMAGLVVADAVRPDSQIRQEEVEIHHPQTLLKEVTEVQEIQQATAALEEEAVLLR